MRILGLDIESSGLNPQTDRIVEIAIAVYDTEYGNYGHMWSSLVWDESMTNIPWEDAEKVHGYSKVFVKTCGKHPKDVFPTVASVMAQCDLVLGHNIINFDKLFLEEEFKRAEVEMPRVGWIDTLTDIEYPESFARLNLNYLLPLHGIVNPVKHKAMFDMYFTMELAKRYDWGKMADRAKSPIRRVEIPGGYIDKDAIRRRRFHVTTDGVYWKMLRELDIANEENLIGKKLIVCDR